MQSGWNAERMQNIGFFYTIEPLLKEESGDEEMERINRHLEFFNTHPYLAGGLAAAVARMENGEDDEEAIRAFKQSMMGPFGALGDSFFWFSLKPLAVLAGVVLALSGKFLLAVLVPLILYNVFHLWIRIRTFGDGLNHGVQVVSRISKFKFALANATLGMTSAVIIAFLMVCTIWDNGSFPELGGHSPIPVAITVMTVLLGAVAVKKGLRPMVLLYLVAGFSIVASFATI